MSIGSDLRTCWAEADELICRDVPPHVCEIPFALDAMDELKAALRSRLGGATDKAEISRVAGIVRGAAVSASATVEAVARICLSAGVLRAQLMSSKADQVEIARVAGIAQIATDVAGDG